FDIDEIAQEALEMPNLHAPSLTMAEIEKAFNRPDVRPGEMAWRPLDPGSYAVKLPGMTHELRATTRGEVFDDHGESHVFLSLGGEVFDRIVEEMTRAGGEVSAETGHVWLVCHEDGRPTYEVVVFTTDGPKSVKTLGELLEALERLGEPGKPDSTSG